MPTLKPHPCEMVYKAVLPVEGNLQLLPFASTVSTHNFAFLNDLSSYRPIMWSAWAWVKGQPPLREAEKNTPLPTQEQGVWPGCGQGTSRWVGLTYTLYFYPCLHVQQEWMRSKNTIKVLEPGLKSPEGFLNHSLYICTTLQPTYTCNCRNCSLPTSHMSN